MIHSEELRDILIKLYRASLQGDLSFFESVLLDGDDGLVLIGSKKDELWKRRSDIIEARKRPSGGTATVEIVPGDLEAFAEGASGWVFDTPTLVFRDGSRLQLRLTATFVLKDGWKLVQQHVSVGV